MENKAKIISAKVLKTAMDKSAVVSVERLVKHPVNGKYIKRSTKLIIFINLSRSFYVFR